MSLLANSYTGHLPNSGGLQGHSIGEDYPFMVVGTHHRHPGDVEATVHTRYYVQNLATGERYYWRNPMTNKPQTWYECSDAHAAIGWIKGGHTTSIIKLEEHNERTQRYPQHQPRRSG